MICYDGEGLPDEVKAHPEQWQQDEDVLDTWFSSALWPFTTLGWPNKTPELKRFYPNSVLVTGHDILFFWVARMLMMGEYVMEQPPFPETFLNGLIYGKSYWRNTPTGGITYVSEKERQEYDLGKPTPSDVHFRWEKMSKSKGNIIDPLEIIEEYGTDALRMALCASATQAREIDLDRRRFEEFKNFANKVWNGARFVFMNLESGATQGTTPLKIEELSTGLDETLLTLEDQWILSTLNRTVRDVNRKLETYQFDQAALEAYDFFWKEFCSYYVEIVKPVLFGKEGSPALRKNKQKLLLIILCQALRLIHPMAPFISEELFQLLKRRFLGVRPGPNIDPYTEECIRALSSPACIVAPYPQVICVEDINPTVDQAFDLLGRVIYAIRNIRGEMKLPPNAAIDLFLVGNANDAAFRTVDKNRAIIAALVRTQKIEFHTQEPKASFASTGIVDGIKIVIPLPSQLLEQEKVRLAKEKERLTTSKEKVELQLRNPEFVQNAPPALIEKQRQLLQQTERELTELVSKLESFN